MPVSIPGEYAVLTTSFMPSARHTIVRGYATAIAQNYGSWRCYYSKDLFNMRAERVSLKHCILQLHPKALSQRCFPCDMVGNAQAGGCQASFMV